MALISFVHLVYDFVDMKIFLNLPDDLFAFTVANCSVADVLMCVDKGYCYYKHQICDGVAQCPDGQDERNCQENDDSELLLLFI